MGISSLRSVKVIKAGHNFQKDLLITPAVDWMKESEIENYEEKLKTTVQRLEEIDNNFEYLLRPIDDEYVQFALERTFFIDEPIKNLKDVLLFKPFIYKGKVQFQRNFIRQMTRIAKGKEDVEETLKVSELKAAYEVNPRIGKIQVDNKEKELKLHESISLFSSYLVACEHEFLKQFLNANFDQILHQYDITLSDDYNKKPQRKLVKRWDGGNYHFSAVRHDLLDRVYYRRARDYTTEVNFMYNFLAKNQFSKSYLIRDEDIRGALKAHSPT
jgi:hypothetical protein